MNWFAWLCLVLIFAIMVGGILGVNYINNDAYLRQVTLCQDVGGHWSPDQKLDWSWRYAHCEYTK